MSKTRKPYLTSKTVTTPSTAVAISDTDVICEGGAVLQAKKVDGNNTGNVFVGDSTLDQGVKEGIELAPGGSMSIENLNLKDLYIDADTAGDGVVVFAMR